MALPDASRSPEGVNGRRVAPLLPPADTHVWAHPLAGSKSTGFGPSALRGPFLLGDSSRDSLRLRTRGLLGVWGFVGLPVRTSRLAQSSNSDRIDGCLCSAPRRIGGIRRSTWPSQMRSAASKESTGSPMPIGLVDPRSLAESSQATIQRPCDRCTILGRCTFRNCQGLLRAEPIG